YVEVSHYIDKGKYYRNEISNLKKIYKVETDKELLMAIKPHPRSIAIAQAAMESAWATSRFFKKANNIFGVWSFSKNEPRIAAGETRGTKTIWLRKYTNIKDSVRDYYKTLARSPAFKKFRELKMKTDDPYRLVKKLDRYSEIGDKYAEELTSMIKYNKFYLYDK
ncbi:MAG: glucosaminidase domain-containing protein, partial [Campylobacterota bacterium]|nr:glucosaminidase domain-containing protein [Campylobacterota bacterium]